MGIRRRAGVSYEPSGESVVILDAEGTVLTTLNAVGAVVWKELDGERDARALARDLVGDFDGVDEDELAGDIETFIESLAESSLVDVD
ncbi:MAG: PqqD family protein [Acidimicrobiales bacterium]|nr:PqqD family protein [Acidimicrobiales bacterium]